jgi:hypothetical protein
MKELFRRNHKLQIYPEKLISSGSVAFRIDKRTEEVTHKDFSWEDQHAGDCTLQFPQLLLYNNGWFEFSGNLSSSNDDDSWGILHFDFKQQNGLVIYSPGPFWSPTIGDWAPWIISAQYPQYLYDSIQLISFTSHC